MTLSEYEDRIDELAKSKDAQESTACLLEISASIRRTAWSGPFTVAARDLAARADGLASEIAAKAGLGPVAQLPRWPGGVNGAGNLVPPVP